MSERGSGDGGSEDSAVRAAVAEGRTKAGLAVFLEGPSVPGSGSADDFRALATSSTVARTAQANGVVVVRLAYGSRQLQQFLSTCPGTISPSQFPCIALIAPSGHIAELLNWEDSTTTFQALASALQRLGEAWRGAQQFQLLSALATIANNTIAQNTGEPSQEPQGTQVTQGTQGVNGTQADTNTQRPANSAGHSVLRSAIPFAQLDDDRLSIDRGAINPTGSGLPPFSAAAVATSTLAPSNQRPAPTQVSGGMHGLPQTRQVEPTTSAVEPTTSARTVVGGGCGMHTSHYPNQMNQAQAGTIDYQESEAVHAAESAVTSAGLPSETKGGNGRDRGKTDTHTLKMARKDEEEMQRNDPAVASPDSGDVQLNFKLLNGENLVGTFRRDSLLLTVRKYIDTNRTDGDAQYSLNVAYPRRRLLDEHLQMTLQQLEIVNRSTLMLQPQSSPTNSASSAGPSQGILNSIGQVFSYVNPFQNLGKTEDGDAVDSKPGRGKFAPTPQDAIIGGGPAASRGVSIAQLPPPQSPSNPNRPHRSNTGGGGGLAHVATLSSLRGGSESQGDQPNRNEFYNGNSLQFGGNSTDDDNE